ncbi:uncharacterized protein LOC120707224 [Panicum virgatum]|uniref:No apical meristem-associated C-terminal domain-containing protein n=1 Tax=Panicum virgatum TaxID=38727 RepID=A0A8T0SNW5_PANVG|nr:uncharacterized protein LOC120707224 [Panicum virgatum]KAG2598713.1 hypothetical protein PVAP13_5KG401414 [Panicum virgatum]
MDSPMGSFLDSVSEHNQESDSDESQSESTHVEADLAILDVIRSMTRKSTTKNSNQKRQRTSATASLGSSTPGSDESLADDEGEGFHTAKAHYVEMLENMWTKKKEFETFKENRKQERHDQIIALEKEKIELRKKDLELRRWIQDNTVMSMDISGMSEQQQKYFLTLQDEIFARRIGAGSG